MNARCPKCKHVIKVPLRRGDKISNYRCRRCRVTLQGATAGRAAGVYLDPITGYMTTAGLTGCKLDQPMRLVFRPGTDGPGRHRAQPDAIEREQLARVGGRVLGAGCVVSSEFDPHRFDDADEGFRAGQLARAGLRLVPADAGDTADQIVNAKVTYRHCAACGARVADLPEARVPMPWTPARDCKWKGSRQLRHRVPVRQGPHPAGSLACSECDPGHSARI